MSKYYNLRSRKEPVSDEFIQHITQLEKLIQYFDQEPDTMSTEEQTQLKEEAFVGDTMDAPAPEQQPEQLQPIEGVEVKDAEKVNALMYLWIFIILSANLVVCGFWFILIAQDYMCNGPNMLLELFKGNCQGRQQDTTTNWCTGGV